MFALLCGNIKCLLKGFYEYLFYFQFFFFFFFFERLLYVLILIISAKILNPLSANPTKWSNTLKQLFGLNIALNILYSAVNIVDHVGEIQNFWFTRSIIGLKTTTAHCFVNVNYLASVNCITKSRVYIRDTSTNQHRQKTQLEIYFLFHIGYQLNIEVSGKNKLKKITCII